MDTKTNNSRGETKKQTKKTNKNKKQRKKKTNKTTKTKKHTHKKKTRKPRIPTGWECLWHRVGIFWSLGFVNFLFCFLISFVFLFSWYFFLAFCFVFLSFPWDCSRLVEAHRHAADKSLFFWKLRTSNAKYCNIAHSPDPLFWKKTKFIFLLQIVFSRPHPQDLLSSLFKALLRPIQPIRQIQPIQPSRPLRPGKKKTAPVVLLREKTTKNNVKDAKLDEEKQILSKQKQTNICK